MFSKFLVNTFIKNNEDISDEKVRGKYIFLGGLVGIISNLLLFIIKLSVGLITSSIAIMADAFNNLSDASSSIITIVGFKLSDKPADAEHPFGHGRIEYISALIVSFMVMLVGFQFVKSSLERIFNPVDIKFEIIPFVLLLISIFVKVWLSSFNKFVGNKIDSSALKAASVDALGDVFTSSCVVISYLAAKFTSFPIDGYLGTLVALFILYSGFSLTKETLNPLLGEAPDPELVQKIQDMVLSYDNITGVHDLIIHNYGPCRCMASIHAEVPCDISIMEIHEIIDKAEREISEKLKIYLVIHMDPIAIEDEEVKKDFNMVCDIIEKDERIKSIHDFRVVGQGEVKNLLFDIVIDSEKMFKTMTKHETLINEINKAVKEIHPKYNCIITVDNDYL
ncbi:MAG: cation diffusion facilitator family transporter [Clostridium sp.]|nr:cation diffusion facilitator family transporter [Clostridium sp.]MCI7443907.1 cation diffusion facilitator family transporter [Clostridium sp.]